MELKRILIEKGQELVDTLSEIFNDYEINVIAGFPHVDVSLIQKQKGYESVCLININVVSESYTVHMVASRNNEPVMISISSSALEAIKHYAIEIFNPAVSNENEDFSRTAPSEQSTESEHIVTEEN